MKEEYYVKKCMVHDDLSNFIQDVSLKHKGGKATVILELKELLLENDCVNIELRIDNEIVDKIEIGGKENGK